MTTPLIRLRELCEAYEQATLKTFGDTHNAFYEALSPTVVKALLSVCEAARCIRHWSDTHFNAATGETEGMVVSASHVRELWEALTELDKAMELQQ